MKKRLGRAIALALCALLGAASLTGCSTAEINLMKMTADYACQQSVKVEGNLNIIVDLDRLKAAAEKYEPLLYSLFQFEYDEKSGSHLKGKTELSLSYSGEINKADSVIHLDFKGGKPGEEVELGDLYFDMEQGLIVSKGLLLGMYRISADFLKGYEGSYFYSPKYEEELSRILGKESYIQLGSIPVGYLDLPSLESKDMTSEVTFMTNFFATYTTGMVSQIPGGYKLSMDGEEVETLVLDILQYFIDNIDLLEASVQAYSAERLKSGDLSDWEREEYLEYGSMSAEDKVYLATMVFYARQTFMEAKKQGQTDILKNFYFDQELTKMGGGYALKANIGFKYDGKDAIAFKGDLLTSPMEVKAQTIKSVNSSVDLEKSILELENKYNPIRQVEVTWEKSSSYYGWDYAGILYKRAVGSPITRIEESSYEQCQLVEGHLYLPLRPVCERLGETVTWDAKAKTAYVVKSEKQIPMAGILDEGLLLVKLRDFEKLGYTVDYDPRDKDNHKAVIKR